MNFIKNTVVRFGGAIYLRSTTMNARDHVNMIFIGNHVPTFQYPLGIGGAMHIEKSHLTIENAMVLLFVNNTAMKGGAILLDKSSVTISECKNFSFIGNTVVFSGGGAIYLTTGSDMSVERCSLQVDVS